MLPLYLAAFAFGVVFVGASAFLGGDDMDGEIDGDHDLEIDADGDADLEVEFDADADGDLDVEVDKDLSFDKELSLSKDIEFDKDIEVDKGMDLDKDVDLDRGDFGDAALALLLPILSLRFWTYAATSFGATGALLFLLGFVTAVHLPVALVTGFGCGYSMSWLINKLKSTTVTTDQDVALKMGNEAVVVLPVGPGRTGKVRLRMGGGDVEMLAFTRDDDVLERGEKVLLIQVDGNRAEVAPLDVLDRIQKRQQARAAAKERP